MTHCSIVIPIYNEAENLSQLHARLKDSLAGLSMNYEIILVDDGSTDESPAMLHQICQADETIKVVKLSRNFGHHLAVTAGIDSAKGDIVVVMDGDLQHRPEDISALTEKVREGYDVAYAIRTGQGAPVMKRVASRVFLGVMNRVMAPGLQMRSSLFVAMNRKVADALRQCRESSRFLPGLINWLGFEQVGVEVQSGERVAGVSKYSFWGSIKLAVNTITSFSNVPLRIAIWLGLFVSSVSFAAGIYVIARKLLWDVPVQGYPSLMVAVLFIGGAQLIMLGVVGEYIGRSYTQLQNRPLYIVDEVIQSGSTIPGDVTHSPH